MSLVAAVALWAGCGDAFHRDVDDDGGAGGSGATGSSVSVGQTSSVSTGQSSVATGTGGGGPEGTALTNVNDCDQLLAADDVYVYTASSYGLARIATDGSTQLEGIYPDGTVTNFQTKDLVLASDGIYLTGYTGITKIDYDGAVIGGSTGLMEVISVAEGATDIFFTRVNQGAIYNAAKSPLATSGALFAGANNDPHAGGIAANDTHVYWASGGKLYVADQATQDEAEVFADASFKASPGSVAIDASHVYWGSGSGIYSMPLGGSTVTLLSDGNPWAIAVDDAHVYWTQANQVLRVPVIGGETELVAQYGDVSGLYLTLDETNVYWIGCEVGNGPADPPSTQLRTIAKP